MTDVIREIRQQMEVQKEDLDSKGEESTHGKERLTNQKATKWPRIQQTETQHGSKGLLLTEDSPVSFSIFPQLRILSLIL